MSNIKIGVILEKLIEEHKRFKALYSKALLLVDIVVIVMLQALKLFCISHQKHAQT